MTIETQAHPQYKAEREVTYALMRATTPTDHDLAELARLLIRFNGFPGAHDIQQDLEKLLQKWGYTRDTLFARTRELHQQGIYQIQTKRDDWT